MTSACHFIPAWPPEGDPGANVGDAFVVPKKNANPAVTNYGPLSRESGNVAGSSGINKAFSLHKGQRRSVLMSRWAHSQTGADSKDNEGPSSTLHQQAVQTRLENDTVVSISREQFIMKATSALLAAL